MDGKELIIEHIYMYRDIHIGEQYKFISIPKIQNSMPPDEFCYQEGQSILNNLCKFRHPIMPIENLITKK